MPHPDPPKRDLYEHSHGRKVGSKQTSLEDPNVITMLTRDSIKYTLNSFSLMVTIKFPFQQLFENSFLFSILCHFTCHFTPDLVCYLLLSLMS